MMRQLFEIQMLLNLISMEIWIISPENEKIKPKAVRMFGNFWISLSLKTNHRKSRWYQLDKFLPEIIIVDKTEADGKLSVYELCTLG